MSNTTTQKSSDKTDSSMRGSLRDKVVTVAKTISPLHETPRDDYTWEELQKLEKVRRSILTRSEDGFWKTLSYWKGTCLQILLFDSLLWIVLGIYAGIRIQARLDAPTFVAEIGGAQDIAVIGGFLSFFLVFYVNQNHKRYFGLYENAMACKGRIFDVSTMAVAYLPKEVAMRLVRYMNAAHAAGYVGLSKTYPSTTFFDEINRELRLLTDEEYDRMKECDLDKGGACNRELIAWCMMEVHRMHRQGVLDHQLANEFRTQILGLRAAVGKMFNAADLPTPYFYTHFICFLTVVYLPLFAISAAYKAGTGNDVYWAADVVGGLIVFLQTIFVRGLRVLGRKMSDPWGDDEIDLSVIHFVIFNWRMSKRVLKAKPPRHDASLDEELDLAKGCIDVGKAWEYDDDAAHKAEDGKNNSKEKPVESTVLDGLGEAETFHMENED